jgi:hypothetical protein
LDIQRIIDVLERSKQDHYSERSGLMSCPAMAYEEVRDTSTGVEFAQWQHVEHPERCDCGATKVNADIDALVAELKAAIDAI